jgi:glycosyltransferase involved in cell wall biosynthesis
MRITALVKNPEHVCCRYRLSAFRPMWEQEGYQLLLRPWPRTWLSRLLLRRELGRADIVILQRKLLPAWQVALLRRATDLLLFDFDDAVFLRDSYAPQGCYSSVRTRLFATIVRACDAVLAGNDFLRDHATLWTHADRVHVIRTCIDPSRYPLAGHEHAGNQVQLVWIGSASTLRGLDRVRPLLEGLGQRWPGLTFKIICDRFLQLRHLPVLCCPWSQATEASELALADIGVSWLPGDLWSRGKCCLKVLQYMAAGLPVVANPVGMQAHLVRHGETGFLVETPEQWAEAIGRLGHDPDLRRLMGRAGRKRVEEEFSVAKGGQRWLEVLRQIEGRKSPQPKMIATADHQRGAANAE